ncbi:MAG: hypothetical protein JW857_04955 [Bacteroidales bacterium]|nr:hypothetical protein [Bacteroidales bacterium]
MKEKFKNKYRIEPNRLQYWDYSAPGNYFITIITENRNCIFGTIKNGLMQLSKYGRIVENEFLKINHYNKRVQLDEYIVMPNHVHCIITLTDYNDDENENVGGIAVEKIHEFSLRPNTPSRQLSAIKQRHKLTENEIKQYRKIRRNMVLIKILGKFKQQTSKHINMERNTPGYSNWQSDFYDHIIRNNGDYKRIKNYIANNPAKWAEDKLNK